jgi:hypothetical protein
MKSIKIIRLKQVTKTQNPFCIASPSGITSGEIVVADILSNSQQDNTIPIVSIVQDLVMLQLSLSVRD